MNEWIKQDRAQTAVLIEHERELNEAANGLLNRWLHSSYNLGQKQKQQQQQ